MTYLLEGGMAHRDSAGHEGRVEAGGAQWMTSGRGIVHAERPFGPDDKTTFSLHGMQLWTTLPRALKMMPPRYQRIDAKDVPSTEANGARIRVIAGECDGLLGTAEVLMPLFLWHVALQPGAHWTGVLPLNMEAGVYVMAGKVAAGADASSLSVGQLGIVNMQSQAAAQEVSLRNNGEELAHIMLLGGAPAEGPLVFHGPFVMNSVEQIRAAEKAYVTGQMGALA
ncbi:MAG: pirin-like C-terminal cupin domain-containing protein [Usitatibacteraceae bacterium]